MMAHSNFLRRSLCILLCISILLVGLAVPVDSHAVGPEAAAIASAFSYGSSAGPAVGIIVAVCVAAGIVIGDLTYNKIMGERIYSSLPSDVKSALDLAGEEAVSVALSGSVYSYSPSAAVIEAVANYFNSNASTIPNSLNALPTAYSASMLVDMNTFDLTHSPEYFHGYDISIYPQPFVSVLPGISMSFSQPAGTNGITVTYFDNTSSIPKVYSRTDSGDTLIWYDCYSYPYLISRSSASTAYGTIYGQGAFDLPDNSLILQNFYCRIVGSDTGWAILKSGTTTPFIAYVYEEGVRGISTFVDTLGHDWILLHTDLPITAGDVSYTSSPTIQPQYVPLGSQDAFPNDDPDVLNAPLVADYPLDIPLPTDGMTTEEYSDVVINLGAEGIRANEPIITDPDWTITPPTIGDWPTDIDVDTPDTVAGNTTPAGEETPWWWNIPILGDILKALKALWDIIKDFFVGIWTAISDFFTMVKEQFNDKWNKFKDFWDGIPEKIRQIYDTLLDILNAIKGFMFDLGESLVLVLAFISGYTLFNGLFTRFLPAPVATVIWAFWLCLMAIWLLRFIFNR